MFERSFAEIARLLECERDPVADKAQESDTPGMKAWTKPVAWVVLALLVSAAAWSWQSGGILYSIWSVETDAANQVQQLKRLFDSFGALAPLVYLACVIVEVVVAPLPGLMLYAPGGILFGPLVGGGLALLGNVLGAGIACSLTRWLGNRWLSRFFSDDQLEQVQVRLESRGTLLIFLLRLNPMTSSDIVSYAAGFSRIPVWKVMLATACGMAPLCFAQAWLAESLILAFPQLIYPLLTACVLYLIGVVIVLRRILRPAT